MLFSLFAVSDCIQLCVSGTVEYENELFDCVIAVLQYVRLAEANDTFDFY